MLILFFIWLEVLKMPIKRNLILSGSNATHGIDKKRLTVDQVEEIAKKKIKQLNERKRYAY